MNDKSKRMILDKYTKLHRVWRWLPAITWMLVIFLLSARTGHEIDQALPFFQRFFPWITDFNWGHYLSYFILAATFDFAFGRFSRTIWGKILIVVLCGFYGVTDEWHQSFIGGRMMDWLDLRNDVIGAIWWVVIISFPFIQKYWTKMTNY
ncbi:VanZ family protein [Paenibacillus yanchengensis]|uniref:VanZ family protein n=1 Tax=Paenibacillus yanchengensis TaxID=2035833 RepID=A0ABW4YKW1_9BACL